MWEHVVKICSHVFPAEAKKRVLLKLKKRVKSIDKGFLMLYFCSKLRVMRFLYPLKPAINN